MSHREDCLINTVEEAKNWLDRYRHTLGFFDPKVVEVIEALESGQSEAVQEAERDAESARDELKDAEDNLTEAEERIEKLLQQVDELTEEVERLTSMVDEAVSAA
jgi:chromosome segregation ATPase